MMAVTLCLLGIWYLLSIKPSFYVKYTPRWVLTDVGTDSGVCLVCAKSEWLDEVWDLSYVCSPARLPSLSSAAGPARLSGEPLRTGAPAGLHLRSVAGQVGFPAVGSGRDPRTLPAVGLPAAY